MPMFGAPQAKFDASMMGNEDGHMMGTGAGYKRRDIALTPAGWQVNGTLVANSGWSPEVGESFTKMVSSPRGAWVPAGVYQYTPPAQQPQEQHTNIFRDAPPKSLPGLIGNAFAKFGFGG